ncbi:MAG: nicotinate-nucleotide adenylyltransferase [Clostridiales bacterium]|jgi:nicotinate-nucleotide adenylyltransferase|nr:nicotinate-nucleotide adenylyltransferase [Clostridiales bacterium]
MRKIGIMGGTFDPIHNGHLTAAEEVRQRLGLHEVIFVPAGTPPLKDAAKTASARHRRIMCEMATRDNPNFSVSTMEIDREGTSYTIDTIAQFVRDRPDAELFFIVGADAADNFQKWYKFQSILKMCKIVVTTRPGNPLDEGLAAKYGQRIIYVPISDIDISSTQIRDSIARGKFVRYFMPCCVSDYIHSQGLYIGQFEHFKRILQIDLSAERFAHSLSVVDEAEKLGLRHGQGEAALEKLLLAALLHDCAKNFCDERSFAQIKEFCRCEGFALDDFFADAPWLAHSFVGAVRAKAKFGVKDPEVLDAIAGHTFGKPNMTIIDKIIYIADFIEATRAPNDARSHARKLAYEDLDAAMIYILRHTIEKTAARGLPVYKDSELALRNLEENYG